MEKKKLTKSQLAFKRDYFFGIGTGLLATSVAQAMGNKWYVIFTLGAIFVVVGVLAGKNKK